MNPNQRAPKILSIAAILIIGALVGLYWNIEISKWEFDTVYYRVVGNEEIEECVSGGGTFRVVKNFRDIEAVCVFPERTKRYNSLQ